MQNRLVREPFWSFPMFSVNKQKDYRTIRLKPYCFFFYRSKLYIYTKYKFVKTNFIHKIFIYDCLQLEQNYELVDKNKIFSILAFRDQKYEGYLSYQGTPQQTWVNLPKSSFLSIYTSKLRSLL